jgi:hypothetical protein
MGRDFFWSLSMSRKLSLASLTVAAGLSVSVAADAAVFDVTVSEGGSTIASWRQDSNPTPSSFALGVSTGVTVTNEVGLGVNTVTWFNISNSGLFAAGPLDIVGAQAYTGPESAPSFVAGNYSGIDSTSGGVATVMITSAAAAVPEVSTWAMMLAGLGIVCFRRRAVAA